MQAEIHPKYTKRHVKCSCGNEFDTFTTTNHDLQLDICSKCHPFYTGNQKIVDTAGRVERFNRRYRGIKQDKQGNG